MALPTRAWRVEIGPRSSSLRPILPDYTTPSYSPYHGKTQRTIFYYWITHTQALLNVQEVSPVSCQVMKANVPSFNLLSITVLGLSSLAKIVNFESLKTTVYRFVAALAWSIVRLFTMSPEAVACHSPYS